MPPPLVSALAHVELLAPDPAATARLLTVAGALAFVGADRRAVYLRAAADPLRYSVKIAAGAAGGVGHVAWRSSGPEALRAAVAAVAASGRGLGWTPGDLGHGPSYRFQSPSGHVHELLWEADPRAPGADAAATSMRCLDHVALACAADPERDADFFARTLAFRRLAPAAAGATALLSAAGGRYDIGFVPVTAPARGGLDHVGMLLAPGGPACPMAPGDHGIRVACAEAAAISPAFSGGS